MAIKISGNTVIDDSQNITATGSATISGRMLLGTTTEGQQNADNLTIADSGHCGLTIRSGTTSGGAIYFSDATSGGGEYEGYIEYNHPSRFMRFGTAQDEAMRLDSSGRLLVGTDTAITDFYSGALGANIQIEDSSYCAYSAYVTNGNPAFIFGRGNPISGSIVGNLSWMADDGTDKVEAARISALIDGTPGSNDMPGRLVFSTTADGASSTTERMLIDSSGHVKIGGTLPSTPNISLNADGSATFTSTNPVVTDQPSSGNSANPAIQIKHDGTINGSWRHDGRLEVGGQDANAVITLSPDGSATFNGETVVQGTGKFFLKRNDAGATTCAIRDDNLRIFNNPVSYDDFKISLENDGSATFASSVECNTELRLIRGSNRVNLGGSDTLAVFENNGNFALKWDGSASFAGGNSQINSYGQLVITRSDSNAYPSLTINSAGTTTNTIDLNGDGSATFGAFNTSSTTTHGATIDQYANSHSGVRVQSTSSATTVGEFFAAYRGSSAVFQVLTGGNATFAGTITANGGYALSQLTELT